MTARALVAEMRQIIADMRLADMLPASDYAHEWDALVDRAEVLLAGRGRLAPQTVHELEGRATCLHATLLTEFGDGSREDPRVVAVSIGPVGQGRQVFLVSRRELGRVLFP